MQEPKQADIVQDVEKIDRNVNENIVELLTNAEKKAGKLDDTLKIKYHKNTKLLYAENEYEPIWAQKESFKPEAQKFIAYLDTSIYQGLNNEDFSFQDIKQLKLSLDSVATNRQDAVRWAKVDILLTNAFIGVLQDLKQGRLLADSSKMAYKQAYIEPFFKQGLASFRQKGVVFFDELQPDNFEYVELKKAIKSFADSMDTKYYTYLLYPQKDSLAFVKSFKKRMGEAGFDVPKADLDSTSYANLIAAYQKKKKIKIDGKMSSAIVRSLNYTDQEKLKRIFISLDKYKALPAQMPEQYIWVNLPSFQLKVWKNDTLQLLSRTIVGKPETPTPQFNSEISDMVLNPTWTVPASIIKKEMLPGLKRNPNYLARRGLYLLNAKGERVDPNSVNWAKYTNGIPYRIQQGSGDNNALGVMKFNFKNSHAVYLHDTNVRRLFKNASRSLSHGCVRVQEWDSLANFIAVNDSLNTLPPDTLTYTRDSLKAWLDSGAYRMVPVHYKLPLYIKYFTCEGIDGRIKFYDDIYGEDKALRERYFTVK